MFRTFALAAFVVMPVLAQPVFEVASLKAALPSTAANPMMAEMMKKAQDRMFDGRPLGWLPIEKTRLSMKNRSLAGLIASAYSVRMRQVSGPSWITEDRYDVDATFPAATPHADVNEMLRALLEERFGLKTHREEKEESGYALVEAKGGAKLTAAATKTTEEPAPMSEEDRKAAMEKTRADMQKHMAEMKQQAAGNSGGGGFSTHTWTASTTLAGLADWLAPYLGKPVVDATELPGKFDFTVDIRRFGDETEEAAASQALAKLGLRLVPRKVTSAVIVIDQVERTPKPN